MTLRQANGCKQLTLTISLTLTLGLLQWPVGDVSGQNGLSPTQVLQEVLTRYGDNTSISVPQLRSLLIRLNGGQSGDHDAQTQPTKTNGSKVRQKGYRKFDRIFICICYPESIYTRLTGFWIFPASDWLLACRTYKYMHIVFNVLWLLLHVFEYENQVFGKYWAFACHCKNINFPTSFYCIILCFSFNFLSL